MANELSRILNSAGTTQDPQQICSSIEAALRNIKDCLEKQPAAQLGLFSHTTRDLSQRVISMLQKNLQACSPSSKPLAPLAPFPWADCLISVVAYDPEASQQRSHKPTGLPPSLAE